MQNDSGKNVSIVTQQRCTLLLCGVNAAGMRAVYSENLAQSVGDDSIIKWLMGLFCVCHAFTDVAFACFQWSDLQTSKLLLVLFSTELYWEKKTFLL